MTSFVKLLLLSSALALASCGGQASTSHSHSLDSQKETETAQPSSSQYTSESSSGVSSEDFVADPAEILPAAVPPQNAGAFVPDGVFKVGAKEFAFHNVCYNPGKFHRPAIQMKKGDSYIYTCSSVRGALTIKLLGQSFNYYDQDGNKTPIDATFFPAVYGYQSADDCQADQNGIALTASEEGNAGGKHQEGVIYAGEYENSRSFRYFRIVNDNSYAAYLASIAWVA